MAKLKYPEEIQVDLETQRQKILISRGVPGQDFPSRRDKWELEAAVCGMELNIARCSSKRISATRQIKNFQKVWENPLYGPYILGISSFPSDARAKALAIFLMNRAVDLYSVRKGTRSMPLWHRVYGSLGDPLRDRPSDVPALLVISNIDQDSTGMKVEKVRDLLERFSDIPRIVVSTGGPTCDLFAHRLHYKCTHSIHLGPRNLVEQE